MEVLLKKNMDNLGEKDEIVTVKNGFGRNYLIPRGIAVIATESIKKMNAETLRQRAHKLEKIKLEAEKLAKKLEKAKIVVGAKVGEQGKIFGSVSNVQLATSLQDAGYNIERKDITLADNSIKTIGKYKAEIKVFKGITVNIEFEVAEE
jgi:large subunit ribosomal protein L9